MNRRFNRLICIQFSGKPLEMIQLSYEPTAPIVGSILLKQPEWFEILLQPAFWEIQQFFFM